MNRIVTDLRAVPKHSCFKIKSEAGSVQTFPMTCAELTAAYFVVTCGEYLVVGY